MTKYAMRGDTLCRDTGAIVKTAPDGQEYTVNDGLTACHCPHRLPTCNRHCALFEDTTEDQWVDGILVAVPAVRLHCASGSRSMLV